MAYSAIPKRVIAMHQVENIGTRTLPRMTVVDPAVVSRMEAIVTSAKAEVIQGHFGISVNTWTKLRNGVAIRTSVAERLLVRMEQTAAR